MLFEEPYMRRLFFVLGFSCIVIALFAQEVPVTAAADVQNPQSIIDFPNLNVNIVQYVQLDILASQKLFKTPAGIKEMGVFSFNLDPFYRDALYRKHSKGIAGAISLNIITGGMGSIIQGDMVGGLILQSVMLLSYTTAIFSMTGLIPGNTGYLIAEIGGGIGFAGGILLPIFYASSWNKQLARALNKAGG